MQAKQFHLFTRSTKAVSTPSFLFDGYLQEIAPTSCWDVFLSSYVVRVYLADRWNTIDLELAAPVVLEVKANWSLNRQMPKHTTPSKHVSQTKRNQYNDALSYFSSFGTGIRSYFTRMEGMKIMKEVVFNQIIQRNFTFHRNRISFVMPILIAVMRTVDTYFSQSPAILTF